MVKRVELEPISPGHAQFRVQLLEIAEDGVIFEKDKILVSRVFGKDGYEDLNIGMEYPLEVPWLWAIWMVFVELLADAC